jgi:hypothetical protein
MNNSAPPTAPPRQMLHRETASDEIHDTPFRSEDHLVIQVVAPKRTDPRPVAYRVYDTVTHETIRFKNHNTASKTLDCHPRTLQRYCRTGELLKERWKILSKNRTLHVAYLVEDPLSRTITYHRSAHSVIKAIGGHHDGLKELSCSGRLFRNRWKISVAKAGDALVYGGGSGTNVAKGGEDNEDEIGMTEVERDDETVACLALHPVHQSRGRTGVSILVFDTVQWESHRCESKREAGRFLSCDPITISNYLEKSKKRHPVPRSIQPATC